MTNDWNTPMPPTDGLSGVANDLGNMGFDVHTIKVILDNGEWVVEMESTDMDMLDQMHSFVLGHHGSVERI